MLKLPGVTLVIRDAYCPDLARLALQDTLKLIKPEEVLVFSPNNLHVPEALWWESPKWITLKEHCEFFWYKMPEYIRTPMVLSIEWDGWVIAPSQWSPEFMEYDFVGAPWWYNESHNVGNGLGLRSLKLMEFLIKHKELLPVQAKEDEVLCRTYRPILEMHGFKWPSEQLASRFSFECTRPSIESKHFMFHDSFNFPAVLSSAALEQRVKLMRENPYIRNSQKLRELEQGRKAMILDRLSSQY
jgi:hypothetical protein